MMSAKLNALSVHKINVFWNKGYGVIFSVCVFTSKILSRDLNYILDVVIWQKFGNTSISMKEVIVTSIL